MQTIKHYLVKISAVTGDYETNYLRLVKHYSKKQAEISALQGELGSDSFGLDSDGEFWVNEDTKLEVVNIQQITDFDEIQVLEKYL